MRPLASRLCTNTVSCCYDALWCHNITVSLQHWGCISCEARATQDCLGLCTPSVWCFVVPVQLPIVQAQYVEFAHRKGRPRVSSAPSVLNRISSPRTAYLSILALNDSIIPYDTVVFWHETTCKNLRNDGNQGKGKLLPSDNSFPTDNSVDVFPVTDIAIVYFVDTDLCILKLSFLIQISAAVIPRL